MELLHLKIACFLYNQFTNYDKSYLELVRLYPILDLSNPDHVKALIKWLRSWGCRQFKKSDENRSISSIMNWYEENQARIPDNDWLIDYNLEINNQCIVELFNNLSICEIANRRINDTTSEVHVGPVGTAKTLAALRPNLFAPWDKPIFQKLELKADGLGYVEYLSQVQNELRSIKNELTENGIIWENIFNLLNKQHNSYPKLIDEFYWVTITKKCDLLRIIEICNNNA